MVKMQWNAWQKVWKGVEIHEREDSGKLTLRSLENVFHVRVESRGREEIGIFGECKITSHLESSMGERMI
jgi:hypothetical protein